MELAANTATPVSAGTDPRYSSIRAALWPAPCRNTRRGTAELAAFAGTNKIASRSPPALSEIFPLTVVLTLLTILADSRPSPAAELIRGRQAEPSMSEPIAPPDTAQNSRLSMFVAVYDRLSACRSRTIRNSQQQNARKLTTTG